MRSSSSGFICASTENDSGGNGVTGGVGAAYDWVMVSARSDCLWGYLQVAGAGTRGVGGGIRWLGIQLGGKDLGPGWMGRSEGLRLLCYLRYRLDDPEGYTVIHIEG